jgi:hypothetical protein
LVKWLQLLDRATSTSGVEIGFRVTTCCAMPSQGAEPGRKPIQRLIKMRLEIFNVEHGACALVTTSGNRHILVDCGDNTTIGWEPGTGTYL